MDGTYLPKFIVVKAALAAWWMMQRWMFTKDRADGYLEAGETIHTSDEVAGNTGVQ